MTDFSKLVGPKPPAPEAPKYPLPWSRTGSRLYDADSHPVLQITHGSSNERFELGDAIIAAMSEKYGQAPVTGFRDFQNPANRQDRAYEVAPGHVVYAESRAQAESSWTRQGRNPSYGGTIDAAFLRRYTTIGTVATPVVLRDLKDRDGDTWFEVEQGRVLMAGSRRSAEADFTHDPDRGSVLSSTNAYGPYVDLATGRVIPEHSAYRG